jgi:hypothetical protein
MGQIMRRFCLTTRIQAGSTFRKGQVSRLVRDTLRLVREQHQALGDGLRLLDDRILRLDAEMYEAGSPPLFPLIKR